jgi:asparagine synthase (glutamine-hydrolysing)
MCGLAGYFTRRDPVDGQLLAAMASAVTHRGPDDAGTWLDPALGIGLAHRRLSIVDLSPAGHQPMHSASGRFVVAFNGEIYNHIELRTALGDLSWRGHSDTETLLAAIEAWGLEETLKKLVGMFAIALWDMRERTLFLARDRFGEKPLYYGWQKEVLLFGSELKALKAHPAFLGELDRDSITLLLRHNAIHAPRSIYRGISKLPPGTFLRLQTEAGLTAMQEVRPVQYWSLADLACAGQAAMFGGDPHEAVDELEAKLNDAIRLQMVADVPLGAFLSGGVDSSLVVALMQAQSSRPIRTFTIGFHEADFNEAVHAKAVARHLGTDHTELYVTATEAQAVIPRLPEMYDEPFADSSQIPTFLVSQLARRDVTVSLSGDAGDELFGGYNRYFLADSIWRKTRGIPRPLRDLAAASILGIPVAGWDGLSRVLGNVLPKRLQFSQVGDKAHKLAEILRASRPDGLYRDLVSHWKRPADLVIGATEPPTVLAESTLWEATREFPHRMMLLDGLSYLPDDILVKLDRAAMSVSLETRVPFLDHRVAEFAWRLPLSMKIRHGESKWALRQVLYRHVPPELIERPKMGFGVPIGDWLRGPLRDWAEALLNESRLKREGIFRHEAILEKWREHQDGKRNWQYYLWDVLMFQAWLEWQELH